MATPSFSVTSDLTGSSLATASSSSTSTSAAATPDEALRRLHLPGKASETISDIVELDPNSLDTVVRTIDGERDHLQESFTNATNALEALKTVQTDLTSVQDLVKKNSAQGIGKTDREQNQAQIDDLVADVKKQIAGAGAIGAKVFDGSITLTAGVHSMAIDKTDLTTLGRHSANGQTVSLGDLVSHGALDTSRSSRPSVRDSAQKTIDSALDSVKNLQTNITTFVTDDLKQRLGDTADAMEGIFNDATTIGSSDQALAVANDIRQTMLTTGVAAIAIGADGWDKQRLLDLLTPSTSSSTSASSSTAPSSSSTSSTDTSSSDTSSTDLSDLSSSADSSSSTSSSDSSSTSS